MRCLLSIYWRVCRSRIILTAFGALKAAVAGLKETRLYESIAKTFTDLAKPKMTGFGINVATIIKEPA